MSTTEQDFKAMQNLLCKLYEATGIIDNGTCAVCRCGHRLWKLPKCQVPEGPCSNDECPSIEIDRLLRMTPPPAAGDARENDGTAAARKD